MLPWLGLSHRMSVQWTRTGVVVSHVCRWGFGTAEGAARIDGLVFPWTLLLIFGLRYAAR
jgi:hypothetical protein